MNIQQNKIAKQLSTVIHLIKIFYIFSDFKLLRKMALKLYFTQKTSKIINVSSCFFYFLKKKFILKVSKDNRAVRLKLILRDPLSFCGIYSEEASFWIMATFRDIREIFLFHNLPVIDYQRDGRAFSTGPQTTSNVNQMACILQPC